MGTELNNNTKKNVSNGKTGNSVFHQKLPQMTIEIESYDEPPGVERQYVVKLEDLEHYVKSLTKAGGFKEQYEMLRIGPLKPCDIGKKPENKAKNRYQDLLPYDDCRIVLHKVKNDPYSDYINASYVDGYEKGTRYICTQGPMQNTIEDFWRMIWQEDVNVISMTANIIENGKKKCEKYWPDKVLKTGDLIVTSTGESVFLDYTVRNFKLQRVGVSGHRNVRQYQYTAWPDHGVPVYPLSLILMMQEMKDYQKAEHKRTPWVLHCSAGVGRSGTMMILDSALEMTKAESKVDVLGLLYRMRQQRVNLIETVEQYTFVYRALVEYHFGDVSCKPANEIVLYFNKLRQVDAETKKSGLELQFERLRSLEPEHFQQKCLSATTANNKNKNRDPYIIPPDHGRPVLKTNPPSNYINAVYTYNFGKQNQFVATQYPLPNTVADFWQLLWDTGAYAIVVLNAFSNKDQEALKIMASNPFKERVHKHQSKQPLLLPQKELDRLIANSKSIQDENQKENDRLEERKKRQEATKALSKLIAQNRQPGSEFRKQEHAKAAHQELEREKKIEDRKNFILDLAYKRLFEETDRVKQFKIAKNLSVTLKERDKQVEAKNDIVDLTSKYEAKFLHGMLRDVESHWEEEKEKVEKKKRDKLKNAENWKKQREEKEEKQNQADWERHRDGCIIREAAANYEKELEVAARRQKQKIEEYKMNLDHQIDQKQVILEMYSKLDKADDERAKIFNNAKADMKMEHQNIKNELDKKREQKRQYVAMNLRDETCAIEAKERDILQKAILQEEAKYRDQCAMKQAKKEKALKSILDFYEKELASKSERAYDAKRQGLREKTEIFEHVEEQERVEDAKLQARRNREKEAQHLQLHQIAKRRMDKQAEKLEDVEDYLNHMKSLNREEEIFQKYAQMEIADCEARGIDTRPMRFAARPGIECGKGPLYEERGNIRPRYYSATAQGDELNHNCPVFWPPSGSLYQGSIKIEHISSEPEYFGGVLIRKFRVKNPKGKNRTVKTFHLHGWRREEFVPPTVDTIVQLIAKVEKWTKKNRPAPVIVTCYDGCRAAGFYCASSYIAEQIHDTRQADIVQAVRTVRLNRPAFVPTVEQYRWLYELACFLVSEKIVK